MQQEVCHKTQRNFRLFTSKKVRKVLKIFTLSTFRQRLLSIRSPWRGTGGSWQGWRGSSVFIILKIDRRSPVTYIYHPETKALKRMKNAFFLSLIFLLGIFFPPLLFFLPLLFYFLFVCFFGKFSPLIFAVFNCTSIYSRPRSPPF
jgi:hypothetical protein